MEEEDEEETLTTWVLATLGGAKEEIFEHLINTVSGNASWVEGIIGTLENKEEEDNEIYRGGRAGYKDNEGEIGEVEKRREMEEGDQEEGESESCAVLTWRCLSQVFIILISNDHIIYRDSEDIVCHQQLSLRSLKAAFVTSADLLVFGGGS